MSDSAPAPPRLVGLSIAHWIVLGLSGLLTVSAWYFASSQVDEKNRARFDRHAQQVVDLLRERMEKYEGGLWAGVGLIQAQPEGAKVTRKTWQAFTQSIDLPGKFPGINGVGIIYHVESDELESYHEQFRDEFPDLIEFAIHPQVAAQHHFPITYIEPLEGNEAAVGLDMAFESQRHEGALRTMESGLAQITGPITLVQDSGKSPGFLFFAPFYERPEQARTLQNFAGLVYGPFVVPKLMAGTLRRSLRPVELRITDAGTVLYDEFDEGPTTARSSSAFAKTIDVELYGRIWTFDVRASEEFLGQSASSQPALILWAGLVIDTLLFALFLALGRSRRRAVALADAMTASLRMSEDSLKQRNEELLQFNYRSSHDLVSPLRSVARLTEICREDLADGDYAEVDANLGKMHAQVLRMQTLISDIFELGRSELSDTHPEDIELGQLVDEVLADNASLAQSKDVTLRREFSEPMHLVAERIRVTQILTNLVTNGIKYSQPERAQRFVGIDVGKLDDETLRIEVRDNGLGIPEDARARVFDMFFRAHSSVEYGSGLGMSIVRRHVQALGGEIRLNSGPDGTTFIVELPSSHTRACGPNAS